MNKKQKVILIIAIVLLFLCACTISAFFLLLNFAPRVIHDLDPNSRQFDTRSESRFADMNQLISAVKQYETEKGKIESIPNCSKGPIRIGKLAGYLNLNDLLVPDYLLAIPADPISGSQNDTRYTLCRRDNGQLEIEAIDADLTHKPSKIIL